MKEDGRTIDLSLALPQHIVLRHITIGEHDGTRPDWDRDIITVIDARCGEDIPPIFPGYGVFANTCPLDGTIDLGQTGVTLPPSFDYHFGNPPKQMFWYEFIDGTSTGFWPSTGEQFTGIESLLFTPTFASCSCLECPSDQPSTSPTLIPTYQPSISPTTSLASAAPSFLGTAENTREFVGGGCPVSTYEECSAFAQSFCITNGKGNTSFGQTCAYSSDSSDEFQRKLIGLEEIVAAVDTGVADRDTIVKLISQLFDQDGLSGDNIREFLEKEILLFLEKERHY